MIDENIEIDKSKLPKIILNCIEKLEHYNNINDEIMYILTVELLETTAKSCALENMISTNTYKKLMQKYGGDL